MIWGYHHLRKPPKMYIYLEPNFFPCFDWKRPCFGGLKPKNRGQTGSRYVYLFSFMMPSRFSCRLYVSFFNYLDGYQRVNISPEFEEFSVETTQTTILCTQVCFVQVTPQKILSKWAKNNHNRGFAWKKFQQYSPQIGGEKRWFTMVHSVTNPDKNQRKKVATQHNWFSCVVFVTQNGWKSWTLGNKQLGQYWRSYHYSTNVLS